MERIGGLPEGHGIGLLVREPEVLLLEDLSQHPASVGFPAHHPPTTSFLGVPITVRDTVYGNLYLTDSREGRGFTGEDIELVTALAGVAGVAIDNARLHDRSLRRERWLAATRDVAGALLRGTDTTQVLARVAARARDLADADVGTVAVVDDGGQQLTIVAADRRHAARLRDRHSPWRARSTVTCSRAGVPQRQTSRQLTEPTNRSPTWTASARRCASHWSPAVAAWAR